MANVTTPTDSTLPVAGGDIIAAPLSGWITNLKNFVEGANIDENNVDYTSFDGIVVKSQTQTLSGAKTFSSVITATAGLISGSNIVSDTDSTDNLGTTLKRWANLYVDSIGDTGQDLTIAATTTNLPSGHITDYNSADVTITHSLNTLTIAGGTTVVDALTSGGNIVSDTDSTDDLGTTGVRWANLYVDDVTVTNNVTIGGTLTLTGGITLNGNTTIGDSSADTLTVNSTITSNLIFTDNTYDIGASGATRPRDLFLSRNAVMGGTLGVTGATTLSSTLGVTGALTATAGITSGSDIVSDSDSTDDLGTTSVRWANLYVDSIGDTGQALAITAGSNNINVTAGTLALTGAQTISSTLGVTGLITATGGVSGNVTGNLTGDVTGNISGNVTGGTISGSTATFSGLISGNGGAEIGSNTAKVKFYSDSTYSGIYNGSSLTSDESYYFGNGDHIWYSDGSESMRLDGSNVGIGTLSPSTYSFNNDARLVVANTSANSTISIASGTSSSGYLAFADGTTGTDRYSGQIQYNHSTNTMSFKTGGGVEAMTINSAQDVAVDTDTLFVDASADGVGIGTSSIPANHQLAILGNYTAGFYRDYADGVSNRSYNLDIGAKRNSDSALTAAARILGELKANDTDGAFYVYTLGGGTMNFRLKLDESGNMGLGVSPSTWGGGLIATQTGSTFAHGSNASSAFISYNQYYNGTNNIYLTNDYANRLQMDSGAFKFYTAPSGTAGNTASFTAVATILQGGDVGLGTQSPEIRLSVTDTYNGSALTSNDIPAVQIINEQGSYTANNVLGVLGFGKSQGFASGVRAGMVAYYSGTGSQSSNVGAYLAFRTSADAAGDSTERARIDASGNLLVGYTSSNGSYLLQVNSQIFATNATIATSDGRYKEDVQTLSNATDLVTRLNPVQFRWKAHETHNFDVGKTDVGFIAQEVQAVLSDTDYSDSVVVTNKTDDEEYLGLGETKLIPLLTAALQEAITKIEALETKVAALEAA